LAFVVLFWILVPRVLFPSVRAIRDADSHAGKAAAFTRMTELFGVRLPFVSTSLDRVAARSVATVDRKLAEELLVSAKPGPARDLLIPSIEQTGAGPRAPAPAVGRRLGQALSRRARGSPGRRTPLPFTSPGMVRSVGCSRSTC
jgi:hypothetical protein